VEHSSNSLQKNCLLCDSESLTFILDLKDYFLSGENFKIYKCEKCGLLITRPLPDLSRLSDYYASAKYISHSDKQTDIFGKVYHQVRKYTHRRKYRLIKSFSSGKDILDIGCATGEFIKYCADKGMITLGIEPNEKARKFAINEYGLRVGEESELAIHKTASFDVITMWHVLEHVPDINQRMADIFRLLRNDGTAFIALPNHASYDAAYYKEYWAAWDVPRHLYHFDRQSFRKLAEKHGFELISILPMRFDAYYVSLLSEKYKRGKSSFLNAVINGFTSNYKAWSGNKEYSSLIYVIKKK
jgi:2-polyprenyl-3-methyl-5-hydroxy-6-metoxy-1,4-benzoquinol methylase